MPGRTTSVSSRSSGCDSRAAIASAPAGFAGLEHRPPGVAEHLRRRTPARPCRLRRSADWRRSPTPPVPARAGVSLPATRAMPVGDATAGSSTVKRAPCAGVLSHLDVAAALLDDAVHRGEAESGAATERLGGEERLEDAFENRRVRCPLPCLPRSAPRSPRRPDLARRRGRGSITTLSVRMVSRPPRGIASRALTTRFTITCSTCDRSARTALEIGRQLHDQLDVARRSAGAASSGCRPRP